MRFFAFAALGVLLATSGASLAAQCVVDGVSGYAANQTVGPGNLITSLCGHTISGSGGTCTITMGQDESIASGDCLSIPLGQVVLNMNSHSITCTASTSCGTALYVHTGPSGTNKVLGPGTIVGPWTTGATHAGAGADIIQDLTVTLTPISPSGSTYGIRGFKTNTRLVVTGATDIGIEIFNAPDTLQDSIVADNTGGLGWGIKVDNAASVSGTLSIGNTINVATQLATIDLTDSTVRDAGTCNFAYCTFSGCTCSDSTIDYNGVNFVDNTIIH